MEYGRDRDLYDDDERYGRAPARRAGRGYGDDFRGYSRGYNLSREPNYGWEDERAYAGRRTGLDDDYGRSSAGFERREASYGPGPRRSHLRCRDIMTRNLMFCHPDTSIMEAARMMRNEDIGALPVVGEDGKLEGIVTDRDLVVEGLTSSKPDEELRVADCMSKDLYTANQNDRLVDVINEMGDHQVRRVPVVDSRNRLVGIISMADIALRTDKDRELREAFEDVSKPSSWFGRLAHMFNW